MTIDPLPNQGEGVTPPPVFEIETEDGYPSLWLGIKGGASPPLVVEIEVKGSEGGVAGHPVIQIEGNGSCRRTALPKSRGGKDDSPRGIQIEVGASERGQRREMVGDGETAMGVRRRGQVHLR